MAAAMNGMALHGGIIPFGGTFLIFSDYCRPAIRLSALMQQRIIYIMTHDSIGLGEDGPTHQPVEQLACLRAIPGLQVFRPADAVETAEAWEIALTSNSPSLLALSRQNLPLLRGNNHQRNLSARGAYCLHETSKKTDVTLWASGSEVYLALEAATQLEQKNIGVRVISIPSHSLFEQQPAAYRAELCQKNTLHIAIEAGIRQSWDSIIGSDGIFIGMKNFGASAPAEILFSHFGITSQAIVSSAIQALNKN
jgi:transketolase